LLVVVIDVAVGELSNSEVDGSKPDEPRRV